MILRSAILILSAAISQVYAQDRAPVEPLSLPAPDQFVESVKPVVEKFDGTRFRVGLVFFDQKSREIRFPAKINMTEGLLEFLVVHQNGKVHESLLVTDISATHLNLAFTLLRYAASPELYALPNETGGLSDNFPEVPADIKSGSRVKIDVEWKDGDKTSRLCANEWIQHATKKTAMPAGPWVYGGSEVFDGKYVPESTGDIIAIFISRSAMINYPGDDNSDDDVWLPYPNRVPPQGTEVTVILSPFQPVITTPKP
jgi:hypothetical protein